MNTKLVFFSRPTGWYRRAMILVTGGPEHHVGTLREDTGKFYEMHWQYHATPWAERQAKAARDGVTLTVIDAPVEVPHGMLDGRTLELPSKPSAVYSLLDFLSFIPRALGIVTRNRAGIICSESEAGNLLASGWRHRFDAKDWPPSPHSLRVAIEKGD